MKVVETCSRCEALIDYYEDSVTCDFCGDSMCVACYQAHACEEERRQRDDREPGKIDR